MPRDVKKLPDQKAFYSVLCHANGGIVEDGIFVRFNERKFWWVEGLVMPRSYCTVTLEVAMWNCRVITTSCMSQVFKAHFREIS